jgi:acetylornithine/succinyldiaminopimelate/putrescine aminotransferase
VKSIGKQLKAQLQGIPAITEVRGRGLMLAVELRHPEKLHESVRACREEGLLVDWFLFNDHSLRLYPPLIISETETALLCERIRRAIAG